MKANSEIEDVVPKNERAGEAGPSAPANQETISGPETALVQDWYKAAGEVADFEGLGKALERVIRSFPGGVATTPHAHAAAALAVLKFMSGIPGMALNEATRKECMWILVQTLNGGAGEPMALLRYSDLLLPGGAEGYLEVPAEIGGWLKVKAISTLMEKGSLLPDKTRTHLEELSKGNLPGGFRIK